MPRATTPQSTSRTSRPTRRPDPGLSTSTVRPPRGPRHDLARRARRRATAGLFQNLQIPGTSPGFRGAPPSLTSHLPLPPTHTHPDDGEEHEDRRTGAGDRPRDPRDRPGGRTLEPTARAPHRSRDRSRGRRGSRAEVELVRVRGHDHRRVEERPHRARGPSSRTRDRREVRRRAPASSSSTWPRRGGRANRPREQVVRVGPEGPGHAVIEIGGIGGLRVEVAAASGRASRRARRRRGSGRRARTSRRPVPVRKQDHVAVRVRE